ncbi:MAG TPA: hypothetical protein PKE06_21235, partial [Flavilitoribacter sp.]|nr:hypothetical protein [Flavilitoribacter sp.]HMQ88605.1 hypothetical protein [Flavilitoribacter sp.]
KKLKDWNCQLPTEKLKDWILPTKKLKDWNCQLPTKGLVGRRLELRNTRPKILRRYGQNKIT